MTVKLEIQGESKLKHGSDIKNPQKTSGSASKRRLGELMVAPGINQPGSARRSLEAPEPGG